MPGPVDQILQFFLQAASSLELRPPRIPLVSDTTGTWMTAEQATDPRTWAEHMVRTVRFGEGVRTEDTFCARLEAASAAEGLRFVNAGVPGYGTVEEEARLP